MRKVTVFNSITLDGFFTGEGGDYRWAHEGAAPDPEFDAFTNDNASGDGELVFGRITYDLMEAFWPTEEAAKQMPQVAEGMNRMPKYVFSRSLDEVSWANTTILKGDPAAEIRKLKDAPGADLVIMGSGTIVSQLTQAGLIDEYQFIVVPVVIGKGRTLFDGVTNKADLELIDSRTFKNGKVSLRYALQS